MNTIYTDTELKFTLIKIFICCRDEYIYIEKVIQYYSNILGSIDNIVILNDIKSSNEHYLYILEKYKKKGLVVLNFNEYANLINDMNIYIPKYLKKYCDY